MLNEIVAYFGIAALLFKVIYLIATKLQRRKGQGSTEPGTVVLHQLAPCFFVWQKSRAKMTTARRSFPRRGKCHGLSSTGKKSPIRIFVFGFWRKNFKLHLSVTERAICHGILIMLEEITYW